MKEKMELYRKRLESLHIPRYNELPDIELYMDQLVAYINRNLAVLQIDGKDVITTAMVNNYVKSKVLMPPVKKRYCKSHIAYLMVVAVFKQIYPISKISQMIEIQKQLFDTTVAYDYFCTELENALQAAFSMDFSFSPDTTVTGNEERLFVRASVNSFAQKLLVEKYLDLKLTGDIICSGEN